MKEKEVTQTQQKRILVLCVDRDGDLGAKASVVTPVAGRMENLNAAVALALKDPEEPDANAIFEAVRIYDRLRGENRPDESFEIATLSGMEEGGVGADRKIVAELQEMLGCFPATEVILVTDGYQDEAVLPLVHSRVPVSSVRHIVMKHSESIEESAALISKYLKMIIENPKYSRIALGLPGLLFLVLGVLSIFGMVGYYLLAFVLVLSAFMLVKGFGIDRSIRNLYGYLREYSPPPLRVQISTFALGAGILCIVLGAYLGWTTAASHVSFPSDLAGVLERLPKASGYFIVGSMTLIVVGVSIALSGRAIRWYVERDARLLRNIAAISIVIWSRQVFEATSDLLVNQNTGYEKLVFAIIVGVLIGVVSLLLVFVVHRKARRFFKETQEQVEEFGED